MINNLQYNQMLEEYRRDGKFTDYVRSCMTANDSTLQMELRKAITWEYYKSVTDKDGCNRENKDR